LADDREDGIARGMALSPVSSALDYPRLSVDGFMNKYAGEALCAARRFVTRVSTAVQRTYDLHCRYGCEIVR
jgi:hypothetical protein